MTDARVMLWGTEIGAVSWLDERQVGVFQYAPAFLDSGIQLAPLMMPLRELPYEFPALPRETFKGLPGLLADSLPDKFGNAVIDAWLASTGQSVADFNPVQRLCYIGRRGMGGLEFEPVLRAPGNRDKSVEVARLVELSSLILSHRSNLAGVFSGDDDRKAIEDILRVGSSAGGARAKAILAWNPQTNEFRSGQIEAPPDYEPWIMKFDGVSKNRDHEVADPRGYGKVEYAYHLMARQAGVEMTECRLHHEGGRSHFMTRRFDRTSDGGKVHMQSLCAMAHADFNAPGIYSYEQVLQVMKRLGLPQADLEQQVLRAMFNMVGANNDDHVKNIAFLMDRQGDWRLSPAFDITFAFNPDSRWTSTHQMSVNGKRQQISAADLVGLAALAGIKPARAREMLARVDTAFQAWPEVSGQVGVDAGMTKAIQTTLRMDLL